MSVVTSSGNYLTRLADVIQTSSIFSALIWFRRDADAGAAEVSCEFVHNASSESYQIARVNVNDRLQVYGANAPLSAEFGPNPLGTGVWQCMKLTKNATPSMTVKELTDGDTAWGDSVTLTTGLTERAVDEVWIGRNGVGSVYAPWTHAFIKIWTGIVLSDADALTERLWLDVVTNKANEWANWQFRNGDLPRDSGPSGRTLSVTGTPTYSADLPTAILGEAPALLVVPTDSEWDPSGGTKKVSPGTFDVDWDGHTHPPWSLVEPVEGGTKYLYFVAAKNDTSPDFRSVGVATSVDGGRNWTKYGSNPILTWNPGGPGSPEEGVVGAAVLYDAGTFHCWYSANTDVGGGSIDMQIRYKDSTDGLTFGNDAQVLSVAGDELWAQCAIKIGSTYYLFYTIIDGVPGAGAGRGPLYVISGASPSTLGTPTEVHPGPWSHARLVDIDDDYFILDLCRNDVFGVWDWYYFDKSAPKVIAGPLLGRQTQLYQTGSGGPFGRVHEYHKGYNFWRLYHMRNYVTGSPGPADGLFYHVVPPKYIARSLAAS